MEWQTGYIARSRLDVAVGTETFTPWNLISRFPWHEAPRYLIRDRDAIYGAAVTSQIRAMGIRDKPIAPGSPWQNCFVERLIGTIRRECVDHVIAFGERAGSGDSPRG
jgi:hypothetical protein